MTRVIKPIFRWLHLFGIAFGACQSQTIELSEQKKDHPQSRIPTQNSQYQTSAPSCDHLITLAHRARNCDPRLVRLADRIRDSPDEIACRNAIRELISPESKTKTNEASSLYESSTPHSEGPLRPPELYQIETLVLPSHIIIRPDLPVAPGVPPTAVTLSEVELHMELDGMIQAYRPPGDHSLFLRHAGRVEQYCLSTTSCETVRLTAHGVHIAQHPNVRPGPCTANSPSAHTASAIAKRQSKNR